MRLEYGDDANVPVRGPKDYPSVSNVIWILIVTFNDCIDSTSHLITSTFHFEKEHSLQKYQLYLSTPSLMVEERSDHVPCSDAVSMYQYCAAQHKCVPPFISLQVKREPKHEACEESQGRDDDAISGTSISACSSRRSTDSQAAENSTVLACDRVPLTLDLARDRGVQGADR